MNEALRRHRHAHRWTQAQTAELVSAEVRAATGRDPELDANWISRLERGAITWPARQYRSALCKVFQVAGDADLGLYPKGPRPMTSEAGPPIQSCPADLPGARRTPTSTFSFWSSSRRMSSDSPGTSSVVPCPS
ncbi:helix-turn-helix domain-containing protein [Streptomyces sp. NPDC127110]|uniref:helix-turn-helix domain-containing protein n=1 Tax=Streptomyces sp. NPDC127110 TaxID=3345362 RepID=UPI00363B9E89